MSDTGSTIDSDELEKFLGTKSVEQLNRSGINKKRHDVTKEKLFQGSNRIPKPSESQNISSLCNEHTTHQHSRKTLLKKSKKERTLGNPSRQLYKHYDISDSSTEDEMQKCSQKPEKSRQKPFRIPKREEIIQPQSSKFHSISDSDDENEMQSSTQTFTGKPKNEETTVKHNKPLCKYGEKCYRKNPEHLKTFSHETGSIATKRQANLQSPDVMKKKGKSDVKGSRGFDYEKNVFGFHFTKVSGIPKQHNILALDIQDLLSTSKGRLIASAQFNYMFDIPWLMEQYPIEFRKCPLTIVHGEQRASKQALEKSAAGFPNIKFCQAKLEIMYGTHHTKMMLLLYEDGLRVVIHTSNIVESDWFQKTQGMWVSPKFPKLLRGPSLTDGESCTNFKSDLIEYLTSYNNKELEEWILHLKKHDFSQAKVFVIGSTPGRHLGSKKTAFGHLKLRKVLYNSGPSKDLVNIKWPVIGQFSSIGSLGSKAEQWLCGEWLMSLATVKTFTPAAQNTKLKLIYPTVDNVRCSLEGYPAGTSLPYSYKVALKQPYLKDYLHQWKSSAFVRTEASPHIKTYLRTSPNNEQIAWLLITSANLSKAAWGALEKNGGQLMIRSYELGVLFMPSEFNIKDAFGDPNSCSGKGENAFPVPFDLPLTPYKDKDQPWIWDIPHVHAPDRYGNKWCPT